MSVNIQAWHMEAGNRPLVLSDRAVESSALGDDEVLIRVAGCGVCHTDLGFFYDGVRTGHELPLTLGHEISGVVEAAGADKEDLVGAAVIVPAVIPCGRCELCAAGRGSICRKQIFPGNDVHGGFASHVVVPGRGLCVVDRDALGKSELELADLSVIADAVSTAYQAIVRSGLTEGDVAIFVGAGGVGGFGAQIARAMGAHVIAIDVDDERLAGLAEYGPALTINPGERKPREVKKQIGAHVKEEGLGRTGWKIFETSGHPRGQELAFALLTFGAHLSVVGYTLEKITIRFSNLMAFDATAQGNWGCLPEHYPKILDMVLAGRVELAPFITRRPMSTINDTFSELHEGSLKKRPVLIPDFS